jgi:2-dehydro-3-deoxy-D-arabinonate dehydratase
MILTHHSSPTGPRWALDGRWLAPDFSLGSLLELRKSALFDTLQAQLTDEPAEGPLLPPLESLHEVWACGVTYLRSRDARKAESQVADIYERVYDAERPELFLKSVGWRVVGHGQPVRVRRDCRWNVPEPEMTLVLNRHMEIVGYCAGNDMSSRDIEGDNPLYLPQAKIYDGSCALGPGLRLVEAGLADLPIRLEVRRKGEPIFSGETSTAAMKRRPEELADWLGREISFPHGALLMTGTGIVPSDDFSLRPGDEVQVTVGEMKLENPVE